MLKLQLCMFMASAGGELGNLFLCPQTEWPTGEVKLSILHRSFLMPRRQADESTESAGEEADTVIKAVTFVRSQAGPDSLIGQYI